MKTPRFSISWALILAFGCASTEELSESSRDASTQDTGIQPDAGDASEVGTDSSFDAPDLSTADAPFDVRADQVIDSETLDTRLEGGEVDVQPDSPMDVGLDSAEDASADTTIDATIDAGLQGENVIDNPGFEYWTDGLPDHWKGTSTSIADDKTVDFKASVHGGQHACQLVNTSNSHSRFASSGKALRAGRYDCRYWVRGSGEIRNAFYDGGYSSYSGYETVDTLSWKSIDWTFNLAEPTDVFELIFSLRNTTDTNAHIQIDDVFCARRDEPCDSVTCPEWASCSPSTVTCEPNAGRCETIGDCRGWEDCDANHTCVLKAGSCNTTLDCQTSPATPVCDTSAHTCVAGDPCAGVTCDPWRQCNPTSGKCELGLGRCETTLDCTGLLTACDPATRTCVSSSSSVNLVPNGGFESWDVYDIPYLGSHLIPDGWYGLDIPGSTELAPANVRQYSTTPHAGLLALQLVQSGIAERFTSEMFNVPVGAFTCAYWVRGKGFLRVRTYSSGGWSPYTATEEFDTDTWLQRPFSILSNVREMRVILYASYTDAAREHIQVDDVVCTKNP